jgi:hypothetical protein
MKWMLMLEIWNQIFYKIKFFCFLGKTYTTSISIKVLVREKKIRNRKKKEPQKLFSAKLNTKPLKFIKMEAG